MLLLKNIIIKCDIIDWCIYCYKSAMLANFDDYCFVWIRLLWASILSIVIHAYPRDLNFKSFDDRYSPFDNREGYSRSISVSDALRMDRENLRGLYSKLNNYPELMNRRFKVGSKPPQLPKVTWGFQVLFRVLDGGLVRVLDGGQYMYIQYPYAKKRNSVDLLRAQPVCPYKTEWRLIHRAKNINDTEVIVFQPEIETDGFQWFYTGTCDRTASYLQNPSCPNCCRGIDTSRYESSCVPKKSYIMAYVRQAEELNYDWNWIQIDTGCNCAISSKSEK